MKKSFLKTLFGLSILLCLTVTVCGQQSIQDSCICYTEKQDIRCLECLLNAPLKDSIISNQQDRINVKDLTIKNIESQKAILKAYNQELKDGLDQCAERMQKCRKSKKTHLSIGAIGGLILGVLLDQIF